MASKLVPSTRRFGIEIETISKKQPAYIERVLEENNLTVLNYFDRVDESPDYERHWIMKEDGSLRADGSEGYLHPMEIVSRILSDDPGVTEAGWVYNHLAPYCHTNLTCGLHVHVDAPDLDADSAWRLLRSYRNLQPVIGTIMPQSRREGTRYAHLIPDDRDISNYPYSGHTDWPFAGDRYNVLNILPAHEAHGTVEFRQHSGTILAEKALPWAAFCVGFYEYAFASEDDLTPVEHGGTMESLAALFGLNADHQSYFKERAAYFSTALTREVE